MGNVSSSSSVDLNSEEAVFVKRTVEENPVVLFSKTSCPYCHKAKSIFNDMGVRTKIVELDKISSGSVLQDILGVITDARTVPRVFINGQCIGGCSELQSLQNKGALQVLLGAEESKHQNLQDRMS